MALGTCGTSMKIEFRQNRLNRSEQLKTFNFCCPAVLMLSLSLKRNQPIELQHLQPCRAWRILRVWHWAQQHSSCLSCEKCCWLQGRWQLDEKGTRVGIGWLWRLSHEILQISYFEQLLHLRIYYHHWNLNHLTPSQV